MADYVDSYLVSDDSAALAAFCAQFRNVLGPIHGRAASTKTNEDGTTTEIAAVGDPAKVYACVRTTYPIVQDLELSDGTSVHISNLADGIDIESSTTGAALCGVWI